MSSFVSTAARLSSRLLIVAVAVATAACADPIPAGTDTAMVGNLTAGGKFGAAVGQPAANLQDVLWAQGYGYEGVVACSDETRALIGCQSGEQYLEFQPVEIGRKGHVYLKIDNGRVTQIAWAFKIVPYLDG